MNSIDISLYLRQKKSAQDIKRLIYKRITYIAKRLQDNSNNQNIEVEVHDTGDKHIISAHQFINLLNDYINGEISKFELYFILSCIEASKDLIVENPEAIKILYELSSPLLKYPLSLNYIKQVIYKP